MDPRRTRGNDFNVGVRQVNGRYETFAEVGTATGREVFVMRIRLDGRELDQATLATLHDYANGVDLDPDTARTAHLRMRAIAQNVQRIFVGRVQTGRAGSRGINFSASRINEHASAQSIRAHFTRRSVSGEGVQEAVESVPVKQAARDLYNALRAPALSSVRATRGRLIPPSSSFIEVSRPPSPSTPTVSSRIPDLNLPDTDSDSGTADRLHAAARRLTSDVGELAKVVTDSVSSSSDSDEEVRGAEHPLHTAARATTDALSRLLTTASSSSEGTQSSSDSDKEHPLHAAARETTDALSKLLTTASSSSEDGGRSKRLPDVRRRQIARDAVIAGTRKRRKKRKELKRADTPLLEALERFREHGMSSYPEIGGDESPRRLSIDLVPTLRSLGVDESTSLAEIARSAIEPGEEAESRIADASVGSVLMSDSLKELGDDLQRLSETSEDFSSGRETDVDSTSSDSSRGAAAGGGGAVIAQRARTLVSLHRFRETVAGNLSSLPPELLSRAPLQSLDAAPREWGSHVGAVLRQTPNIGHLPNIILAQEEASPDSQAVQTFLSSLFQSWGDRSGYALVSGGEPSSDSILRVARTGDGGYEVTTVQSLPSGLQDPVVMLTDRHTYFAPSFPQPVSSQFWTMTPTGAYPRLQDLSMGIAQGLSSGSRGQYVVGSTAHEVAATASMVSMSEASMDLSAEASVGIASLLLGAVQLLNAPPEEAEGRAERLRTDPLGRQQPVEGDRELLSLELQSLLLRSVGRPGEEILTHRASTPRLNAVLTRLNNNAQDAAGNIAFVNEFVWPLAVGQTTATSMTLQNLQKEFGQ
ncbi:hypothetical protein [Candidatus Similichlamydia epinepheli]|uniref:hypothetical protein n=1 Tax=Candidatus Similichlamydia epinepheli TaxID=1903953 RepID=UPI0013003D38|nr:hypothetical protein [Candidatus Similichlamydia epinepheli]